MGRYVDMFVYLLPNHVLFRICWVLGCLWATLDAFGVCFGHVLGPLGALGAALGGQRAIEGDHCSAMEALRWVLGLGVPL